MLLGTAILALNDAVLKWLTSDYPAGQIMFCRGIFISLPLGILIWRSGGLTSLKTENPKAHFLRAVLVIIGTFLFISGLKYLPLTDAVAIAFAGPLFITALAQPLLGEKVGQGACRAGMGLPQSGALPSLAQELCRKEMIGIGGISNLRKE